MSDCYDYDSQEELEERLKRQKRAAELEGAEIAARRKKTGGDAREMTLRQHYACEAMKSLLRPDDLEYTEKEWRKVRRQIRRRAREMADELLKEDDGV